MGQDGGYFMVLALRGPGDEQSKSDLGMKLGPKICTLQQKVGNGNGNTWSCTSVRSLGHSLHTGKGGA